ncbi:MAG: hypothetical protein HZB53_20255 [Chloroflexi bacterium]|nr:hypothetical protein [Chloroflexota bacterium]
MSWLSRKRLLLVVALTILTVAIAGEAIASLMHVVPPRATTVGLRHVVSAVGQFAIDYPDSWWFSETPQGDQYVPDIVARLEWDHFSSMMTIHKRTGLPSFEAVRAWGENLAQQHLLYAAQSYSVRTVRGAQSGTLEYTFQSIQDFGLPNVVRRCLDTYRYYTDVGYRLTFCADDDKLAANRSIYASVVDSFAYQP